MPAMLDQVSTMSPVVRQQFPPTSGLSANLDARTVNGSIESDFPITVSGRMNPRELHGQIGQGGRSLDVETVNGSIRVRRLP